MSRITSISSQDDRLEFRRRRIAAWQSNVSYWLTGPLRHVVDVGGYICERTAELCHRSSRTLPVIVDMGCGDAWLLSELLRRGEAVSYIGLDCIDCFIEQARTQFADVPNAQFALVDVEEPMSLALEADVVVNAFNFFELCDLDQAFANVRVLLRTGGSLLMSTIDKTYSILALSDNCSETKENLALYQSLPGPKYGFQRIDLGDGVSDSLEYPSVLYSTEDYLCAAADQGLRLREYREHPFTSKPVPKIYCHYEFVKEDSYARS